VYGDAHPQVANTQVNLARCLAALDDVARAESLCREALRVQREALGENHPETTATQIELGRILVQAGKYSEAESVLAPLVVMPHPLRIESYVTHQGWLPAARRREWPNGHAAETAELLRKLYERRQVVEKHK
jgi:tetratricopeptide (TPR) repeat protein